MVLIEKMSSITAMPRTVGNSNVPRIFGTSAKDGQVYEWDYAENGWKPYTSKQNAE
jgi:hypothetical protein